MRNLQKTKNTLGNKPMPKRDLTLRAFVNTSDLYTLF